MNGYFGNITNTVIYIHDWLIPRGFWKGHREEFFDLSECELSEKLFQKPFSVRSRDQRVGLFIMIICFLTKPWIWKVERRAT